MTLPKITFDDIIVPATQPPREVWEYWNKNYLIAPRLFHRDVAKAEQILQTMVGDIGLGRAGGKLLEGLTDNRDVKILRRWIGLRKAPAIAALVKQELDDGDYGKIVIFGMFQDLLMTLRDELRHHGAVLLFEGTPPEKRARIVKRFQNDPRCKVLCAHIPASTGAMDLTVATEVLVAEADWNDSMNPGAVMRCHNAQQKKPVRVRFAALKDTADERIQQALKTRTRRVIESFETGGSIESFDD